jgi:hypothetical protein
VTVSGERDDGEALDAAYQVGVTIITWTATDQAGNTATCTQTVTVRDTVPPVVNLLPSITLIGPANSCGVEVPAVIGQYGTASDNCAAPERLVIVQQPAAGTLVSAGDYPITVTVYDGDPNDTDAPPPNSTTKTTVLHVQDDTLWPPNHQYHTVNVADLIPTLISIADPSVDISDVTISQVTSDEAENGNGDGNTLNDIVIAPDCKSVQVRAERAGNTNGRVYTITLKVKHVIEGENTVSTSTVLLKVPKSQGNSCAVDDGPHYTVTSNCP